MLNLDQNQKKKRKGKKESRSQTQGIFGSLDLGIWASFPSLSARTGGTLFPKSYERRHSGLNFVSLISILEGIASTYLLST